MDLTHEGWRSVWLLVKGVSAQLQQKEATDSVIWDVVSNSRDKWFIEVYVMEEDWGGKSVFVANHSLMFCTFRAEERWQKRGQTINCAVGGQEADSNLTYVSVWKGERRNLNVEETDARHSIDVHEMNVQTADIQMSSN